MYIKNSIVEDFNNFALDTSAVELRSVDREDIRLPYMGALPQQMSPAIDAYIYFNVQITQEVKVVLVVTLKSGKRIRRPLVVSNTELISLLDKFFCQPRERTGLDLYDLGLWQAHYIDWRFQAKAASTAAIHEDGFAVKFAS